MKHWFNFKLITDSNQRTLGIIFRLFGIDFTLMLLGWMDDWKLLDIRIPVNYGIYCQLVMGLVAIGRLPTSTYSKEDSDD